MIHKKNLNKFFFLTIVFNLLGTNVSTPAWSMEEEEIRPQKIRKTDFGKIDFLELNEEENARAAGGNVDLVTPTTFQRGIIIPPHHISVDVIHFYPQTQFQ